MDKKKIDTPVSIVAAKDYVKLTKWETGEIIYLHRKEAKPLEVTELVATETITVRTRVNTKDNLYLVTESAYQVLSLFG